MKKSLVFAALIATSTLCLSQDQFESYFDGVNVSFGTARNTTKETSSGTESFKTNISQAKINYTFAMAFPAKLGLTATLDLKNSKAGNDETISVTAPTEVTIEPGVVLANSSLLYAKLGTFAARYEYAARMSSLSGRTVGVGIKHYFFGDNFIQFEWTSRTSDAINSSLGGAKYKQTSPSLLVGHTF